MSLGCCSINLRLGSTRGTREIFHLRRSIKLPHLYFHHGQLASFPTRGHRPRFYGLLRTILSKHAASITDSILPVLPGRIPSNPPQNATKSSSTIESHIDYHVLPTNTSGNVVIVDEDTCEPPEATTQHETAGSERQIGDQVRFLMRRVPHPVAIITSTDPRSPTAQTAFRGMTVSSFNTVTLYPETIVSFNVKLPSETFNAIDASSRFLVHLLAPTNTTARLARDFSQGNAKIMRADESATFFQFVPMSGGDGGRVPSIAEGEPPRLVLLNNAKKDGESSLPTEAGRVDGSGSSVTPAPVATADYFPFIFECRYLSQSVKVGNHVIVLGRVVKVICQEAAGTSDSGETYSPEHLCLTYADTRFWKIGETISSV
ncbi:oxidoreductase [Histoplasma capsulatum G186AR]|uniref:Oxidoreductase n=2 Tax=Ajellomyces capsulatus TaxID=5037 RepID=C0NN22_AJECG|nr:oxidoreductase [Histoplasma capsulatum G186AR]EEH07270.1 oxidoreductase [Histoplasma capsulatum G186AR]KAG5304604.1 oxidoreductase [Histoplasma capsulatum]QSS70202.1 oxidoreductase [Histoplasma capsulatum G186AR]